MPRELPHVILLSNIERSPFIAQAFGNQHPQARRPCGYSVSCGHASSRSGTLTRHKNIHLSIFFLSPFLMRLQHLLVLPCGALASAINIQTIRGTSFASPYANKNVTGKLKESVQESFTYGPKLGVHGLVTAKGPQGFWITNFPPAKTKSVGSDSIYVFSTNATIRAQVDVGDSITLNALVSSYRSTVDYLYLTELTYPSNIQKVSVNNTITPLTLGADGLHPPTQLYTGVDGEGVLAVPNNQTVLVASKAPLSAKKFGLDFWESLNGKLVTITSPTVVSFPNSFKNFWIRGDWPATGINERGGLTMTLGGSNEHRVNPSDVLTHCYRQGWQCRSQPRDHYYW